MGDLTGHSQIPGMESLGKLLELAAVARRRATTAPAAAAAQNHRRRRLSPPPPCSDSAIGDQSPRFPLLPREIEIT